MGLNKIALIQNTSDPTFIFRDEFSASLAVGAVNATKSGDGKATRTVVDTESKISISNGALSIAGGKSVPATGDPGLWYGAQARAIGLAAIGRLRSSNLSSKTFTFGFDNNTSGDSGASALRIVSGAVSSYDASAASGAFAAVVDNTTYDIIVMLRGSGLGAYYFIKGGAFTSWTLLWISKAGTAATVYPSLAGRDAAISTEFIRCAQLPVPFTTDYGIATQQLAGALSSGSGSAFTHTADCTIEWTDTTLPNAGEALFHVFRRQGAADFWDVEVASDGSLILYEYVGGSPTSRGTGAAGSIANGQRLVVQCEGTTIRVFANNVLKVTYTSAANFATATAGRTLIGTGGAVSDCVSYPRTLPSYLQSMLNRYVR